MSSWTKSFPLCNQERFNKQFCQGPAECLESLLSLMGVNGDRVVQGEEAGMPEGRKTCKICFYLTSHIKH